MTTRAAMPGSGHFHWNAGGWFGSELGGTAWMLIGAAVLAPRAPELAAAWLACFAGANAIGSSLWRRRHSIRPYPAIQGLLLACVASGVLSLAALHAMRPGLVITQPPGVRLADEPRLILGLVLMWCGLAPTVHLMERGAEGEESASAAGRGLILDIGRFRDDTVVDWPGSVRLGPARVR